MNNSESDISDVSERSKDGEASRKKGGGGTGATKKGGGKSTRRKGNSGEPGKEEAEEETVNEVEDATTQMAMERLTVAQGTSGSKPPTSGSSEATETGSVRPENAEASKEPGSSRELPVGSNSKDGSILGSAKSREDDERMTMTKGDRFSTAEQDEQDPLLPSPVRRMRGSEVISPTVNGMRQFGLSKGVISRAIVRYTSPPEPHPYTICFHFPSTFLTHRYVLDMVRSVISSVPGSSVPAIQFIDRNTLHGAQGMDNRWLVTLNCIEAKKRLVAEGLNLFNRKITLRNYDDILHDEYLEYLEYIDMQRQLYANTKDDRSFISEESVGPNQHHSAAAAVDDGLTTIDEGGGVSHDDVTTN